MLVMQNGVVTDRMSPSENSRCGMRMPFPASQARRTIRRGLVCGMDSTQDEEQNCMYIALLLTLWLSACQSALEVDL